MPRLAADMEVRWRLFAREVLAMPADDAGEFFFGKPPRHVRGLRLLGVVVRRSRGGSCVLEAATTDGREGAGEDGEDEAGGAFGSLAIDDGTGVVEVRLPLQLWESVALGEQVDVVGRPERVKGPSNGLHHPTRRCVRAEGCYVETDPNVATLRALECINLYKVCYFSRAWSPSSAPLPPLRPDPYPKTAIDIHANPGAGGGDTRPPNAPGYGHGSGRGAGGNGVGEAGVGVGVVGVEKMASLQERLLGIIGGLSAGATGVELSTAVGVPPGDTGVSSALAQMQLDGAIYLVGDCYMPL